MVILSEPTEIVNENETLLSVNPCDKMTKKGGDPLQNPSPVLEYKCPCCNAGLVFGQDVQQMKCPYCDNTFDLDVVRTYSEGMDQPDETDASWEESQSQQWSEEDQSQIRTFICPACAGEILTDDHTAATFCPYHFFYFLSSLTVK